MITIDGSTARRIWEVLRRVVPRRKGSPEPTVFVAAGRDSLTVRMTAGSFALEFATKGAFGEGRITVGLEAWSGVPSSGPDGISLEPTGEGKVAVRWCDQGLPRSSVVDRQTPIETFFAFPDRLETNSGELATALIEARKICAKEGIRFAIEKVCLRGRKGDVAATDGRQMLRWGGFRFPWTDDLLIAPPAMLEAESLRTAMSWQIGRNETHVLLRTGSWTIAAAIASGARFPDVDAVVPLGLDVATKVSLEEHDARFLERTLPRLPGHDAEARPVTIDLNGHVGVLATDENQPHPTELILSRSRCSGSPVRAVCDREYLRRAVGLGFQELRVGDPEKPIVALDRNRLYLFMPLPARSAIAPPMEAIRIESAAASPLSARRPTIMDPRPSRQTTSAPPASAPEEQSLPPEPLSETSPLAMAMELRDHYREGCRRANELVQAIRLQRRQTKLVQSTLASLRGLQVADR